VHHGTVGYALEELYDGRAHEVAELLALHFGRSDEAERAVDYAIAAAEKSQRRWANNEALTYFNDALQRLDLLPVSEANRLRRIDAVVKQAEVKFALGRHAEHIEALDQIREIVDRSDDARRRATWHYWRGFLHILTGGQADLAIEHCNEAASLAEASGLDEIKAFAESCLAQIYMIAGRLREAIECGERALASFEALGNFWWACRTIWHLAPAAMALGEWNVSLNYCRRALEYGSLLEDLRIKVISLWRMGATYIHQGDVQQGVRYCNEALALGALPYDAAMAKAVRGYGKIKGGQVDSGIADLKDAVGWFETSRMRGYTHARYALWLAEGYLRQCDRANARPLIEDAIETSRAREYLHVEGLACWLMAECLVFEAPASAEPHIETAMAILERIGACNDLARAMVTRAALHQAAGDVKEARELLGQANAMLLRLGTLDESARVELALTALGRGAQIPFLAAGS
jgi:tetratricopeptide (TPR) repeat protein